MGRRWAKGLLGLTALGILCAPSLHGQEECGVCHPESRVAFAESSHKREGVGCTGCHGGNPDTQIVERAHRDGFRSLTDRLRIPERCAECHSDLGKMRAYNLPVDQYAVYQTSQHGMAVASGNDAAAVCTDCHGIHDIRSTDSPGSLVHPRNLAATCGFCHGDETRMEPYGLDASVVDEYRSSVHGKALLEAGNTAAPDCSSCHGVHGPTPPGVGDIDKVCGACHEQTRRAFLSGPHYQAMLDAELPECASCHANHAIERYDHDSIAPMCIDCHGGDSEQALLGRKISTLIVNADEVVNQAEELALRGEQLALNVEDHFSRVEEARTYLTEAPPLVHTVSFEAVEHVTRRARSIGEEVQHEINAKLDRSAAHVGLAVFWFYLLMTLTIFVLLRRRLSRGGESA